MREIPRTCHARPPLSISRSRSPARNVAAMDMRAKTLEMNRSRDQMLTMASLDSKWPAFALPVSSPRLYGPGDPDPCKIRADPKINVKSPDITNISKLCTALFGKGEVVSSKYGSASFA